MWGTVFDSEALPPADRMDAWRDVTWRSLTPSAFDVEQVADFRASLRAAELGATQVTAMTYSSLRSRRTPRLIRRSDAELYAVNLFLRGRHSVTQARREALPGVGDLVLYSSCQPFDTRVRAGRGTGAGVLVHFPRALMPLPVDKVDRLLATSLSGRDGMGALLARFLTHVATDTGSYRPTDGPRLGLVLLDLVTALLAHHLDAPGSVPPESRQRALFLRLRSFVHQHLRDPDLTPAALAAAHHISVRHLHRVFQSHGETAAAWIRAQRLERARRDLADPALAALPLRAVAARWGITDPAHFSRGFRAAYGMSPSEYRRQAGGGAPETGAARPADA